MKFSEYYTEQTHAQIDKAVKNQSWQSFRKSLKGLSTKTKLSKLSNWVSKHGGSKQAKLQADNYRNALRRAGQLKPKS